MDDASPTGADDLDDEAESFDLAPVGGPRWRPESIDHSSLVGLDVHEAAERAVALGWEVRASQPGTALTADMRRNRLDLLYGRDGIVTDASPS